MSGEAYLQSLTPQSTLAELPAWDARLPITARGSEVDDALRGSDKLPGVVVFDTRGVLGAISRAQFQQLLSRPFGREVFRPREVGFLLGELLRGEAMVLDASMPVQEAVRRSLQRDESMLYEPVLVTTNGSGEVRLVDFTDLLRADSRISAMRNQQMEEILATVQEGFLLVDRDHRIASEYSRSVETILGRSAIAGRSLPELLGEVLGGEHAGLAHGYLETLFNPNVIERLIGDINPLKSVHVSRREGRPKQHLGFAFKRSTEGKAIRRVLVRLEDQTREVELASELEEQERLAGRRVELAMEMMQVDPNELTDYLTRFLAEQTRIGRLRSRGDGAPVRNTIDAIFRILHSLKGEAGVIGLRSFAQTLHRSEDVATALRDGLDGEARGLEPLDPWIESLRILGAEAKDLIVRLSTLVPRKTNDPPPVRTPDVVSSIESLIAELSSRLGKPARFVARWKPADLPDAYSAVVREALIQLARNSMVHGVETELERRRAGKPVPAILQFALRRHEEEEQIELLFQDDGRGLDLGRIRDRAEALSGTAELDDEQAAQMIFQPGFSTAVTTTGDAGRGVGLDLVRDRVEALGGVIFVHSEPGTYCTFQIVLPLEPEAHS
ncbi:MAG: ATP-binding protein [Thermoanaerobaculia bacterium]|jgi:signal transduction histidine kinase